jgi:hypothetical protein
LVVLGLVVLGGVAVSNSRGAAAPVASLTVSGSPGKPVVTVTGSGLHVPIPNPATAPTKQPQCPLKVNGNPGLDYGTSFYLQAWDGQPNGSNQLRLVAGRDSSTLSELDCIGLIVLAKSPTTVTFTLGQAYGQYYKPQWIQSGDVVEVVLNGVARVTVVLFPPAAKPKPATKPAKPKP